MKDLQPTSHLPTTHVRPGVDRTFGILAAAIAWGVGTYRLGPNSVWESDYRVAQCLSRQSVGWDGIITAAFARLVHFIPLGTEVTRLGLISAAASGLSAWLVYRITCELLRRFESSPLVNAWLAFGSAVLFAVSPSMATAASLPPGPLPALGLVQLSLVCALGLGPSVRASSGGLPRAFLVGLLVALGILERSVLFSIAAVLVALVLTFGNRRIAGRQWLEGSLGVAAGLCAIGLPWWLTRKTALSLLLSDRGAGPVSVFPTFAGSLPLGWDDDLGILWLTLAALGIVILALGKRKQLPVVLLVLALPAWLFRLDDARSDAGSFWRLLALASCLSFSAVGLRQVVELSRRVRGGKSALFASLAVVLQATLGFAHADVAAFRTDRYRSFGIDVFTQEAFARLPASAVLLLRDSRLIRRLTAARYADGLRPDLLVVPMEAATNVAVVSDLLSREPALSPVLRELAINGRPSEFALSNLADNRPVFLEFDPEWDRRLREHLLPLPYLSRLHSQSLGRSDRNGVLQVSQETLKRVFEATAATVGGDYYPGMTSAAQRTTREVIRRRLREQLTLLLALGDRPTFDALFSMYDTFEPSCPWSASLKRRLGSTTKGLDAFDLLTNQADNAEGAAAAAPAPSLAPIP